MASSHPRNLYEGPWARPSFGNHLEPPGTYASTVSRYPPGHGTTEVGIVHEHRFAFWFWNKWNRELPGEKAPALVTIDWHQDLGGPDQEEMASLAALDREDDSEVALFAWSQLHPLNDGHILAAAELGFFREIYVLCRQSSIGEESSEDDASFGVHVFQDVDTFAAAVRHLPSVILDIDLDYFTRSPDPCGGGDRVKLVPYAEIERVLHPRSGIVAPLLRNVVGITLAIEPEFCGGLHRAHRLLQAVNRIMFDSTLLADDVRWGS